jgi:hypothetical protein
VPQEQGTVYPPVPKSIPGNEENLNESKKTQESVNLMFRVSDAVSGSAGIPINFSCWIRIRIQIADPDPDPGGQK